MAQEIDITGLKKNFNTTVVGASVTVIAQLAVRTEFSRFYYAKDRVFEFNNRPIDAVNYLTFETPLVVTRPTARLPLFGTNTNNAILVTGQSVLRAGTSTQVNSANTASLFIKGSNPIRLPINMYSGGVGTVNTFTDIQGQPNIYGVALVTTATWAFAIEQLPSSQTSGLTVNSIITVNTSSGNTGNFGTNNTAYVQAINTNQIIVIATSGTSAPVNGTIDGITLTGQTFYIAPVQPLVAQYLIVGGGGGGGSDMGGGGGAGGYLAGSNLTLASGVYTITVGAGGAGAPAGTSGPPGFNGSATIAFGFTALGGGGGASKHDGNSFNAGSGGSGGGGSGGRQSNGSYGGLAGTGTTGQGNNGAGSGVTWYPGGGGGAGAAASQTGSEISHGGIGIANSILGTSYYWAGGGGGAGYSNYGGNGGLGGGGGGAPRGGSTGLGGGSALNSGANATAGGLNTQANVPGGDAGANTGGGGGGGSHYNSNNRGGNGGSGIVVIRYPGAQRATGGTVTTVGGDTVHAFTSTGTAILTVGSGSALPTFRDPIPTGWVFTVTNLASTIGYNVGDVISHVGRTGTLGSTSSLVYLTGINTASNSISGISFGTTPPKLGNINAIYSTGESLANVVVSNVSTSSPYTFVVSGLKSTSGLIAGNPGSVITATSVTGSFGAGNTVIVYSILGYTSLVAYVTTGTSVPVAGIITNFTATGATATTPVVGQVAYTTTGTYSWTAPAGVTSVSVVAVGGGGGGGYTWSSGGGGGGGLGWKNNISVTPGQTYTVVVGTGGPPSPNATNAAAAGGTSYFISTATVAGYGGGQGGPNSTSFGGGYGGGYLGDAGGRGGNAAFQGSWNIGGGGAGGYSGNGADNGGGNLTAYNAPVGSGAGAASGYYSSTYGVPAGGGVGIFGRGADGVGSSSYFGGGGGSGGEAGRGGEASGQSGPSIINGGAFGGGGGGSGTSYGGGWGGRGAVRIIWGSGRSFPVTQTADVGGNIALPTVTTSLNNENIGGSSFVYPSSRIESIPLVIQQNNVPKIASLTITDSRRLVLQRQIISKTGSEFSLRNNNTPVTISLAVPGQTFSTGTVRYQLPLTIEPGGVGFIGTVTQLPSQPNIYGVAVANSSSWAFAIENLSSTQTSNLVVGRVVTVNTSSNSTGNFGTNNTTWVYSIGVGFVVFIATGGSTAPVNGTIDRITITGQTYNSPILTNVDLLLVGGGGSGANHSTTNANGGGGAGGLLYGSNVSISLGSHAVVIGQGGAAVGNATNANGNKGTSSTFGTTFIAHGGGGGVGSGVAYNAVVNNGGSGGGFAQANGGGGGPGLATQINYGGATGYGNSGGGNAQGWTGAGGGGAGTAGVGGSGGTAPAGDGGQGRAYDISGTWRWYAGGGGGGGNSSERAGDGYAGGGRGAGTTLRYAYNVYTAEVNSITTGSGTPNAIPNTGGGGGGGSYWSANGGWGSGSGAGGSGIAIVRYLGGQSGSGGTITSANGYTIHTFTADGTFVFNGTSGLTIPSFRAPTQSPWTFAITGTSVVGFTTGSVLSSLPRAGSFGSNNEVYVTSIDTSTNTINCFAWAKGPYSAPPSAGLINSIYPTGEFTVPSPIISGITTYASGYRFTISNIKGTLLYNPGTVFTATSITGSLGTGSTALIVGVDSFTQIQVYTFGGTAPVAGFIGTPTLSASTATFPATGDASFVVAGTYSWIAPFGVTSVSVVAVGGGGAGWSAWANAAGAGGGLGWKNNITVVPGTSYTVQVGAGGVRNGGAGGNSFFNSLATVSGYGGGNASSTQNTSGPNANGYGGGWVGDGGGAGGNAANYAGGGGAGGYSGNGGNQGSLPAANSGGAAGGGYYSSTYGSGSGGGVGILGKGATATGWWHGSSGQVFSTSQGNGGGGEGGSGGQRGRSGENPTNSTGESGNVNAPGGEFGGGGAGPGSSWPNAAGSGGGGAVRIIWGTGRAFPATNAGSATTVTISSVTVETTSTRNDNIGGEPTVRDNLLGISIPQPKIQNTVPTQVLVNVGSSVRANNIKTLVHVPTNITNSTDYEMAPSVTTVINSSTTGTYIYRSSAISEFSWIFRIYNISSATVSSLTTSTIITANTSSVNSGNFGVGSTVTVYSVVSATSIIAVAYGGGGSSAPVQGPIDSISVPGGTYIPPTPVGNDQNYTTPGTYTFIVPSNATTLSAMAVGGGGAGDDGNSGDGGGGGGSGGSAGFFNGLAVTPGQTLTIVVGAGGAATSVKNTKAPDGGLSSVTFGSFTMTAPGGIGGSPYTANPGAAAPSAPSFANTPGGVTTGGYAGGAGGGGFDGGGGGGGAGGLAGAGGTGAYSNSGSATNGGSGAGGGGGTASAAGIGVANAGYVGGSGGSGQNNVTGGGGGGSATYTPAVNATAGGNGNGLSGPGTQGGAGGFPGGGGGGSWDTNNGTASAGGGGFVRLVWSGTVQAYTGSSYIGTSSTPVNQYQVAFNGTSQYLSIPANTAFAFGTGDFTVEAWVYLTVNASSRLITTRLSGGGASGTWSFSLSPTTMSFTEVISGEPGPTATFASILNTWKHIAAVRSGGVTRLYLNGTQVASATQTTNFNNSSYPLYIATSPSENFIGGYVSNLRIVKGTAVYTSAFTTPTVALTAIPNTVLLTCKSATFVDLSVNALTITPTSSPTISVGTLSLSVISPTTTPTPLEDRYLGKQTAFVAVVPVTSSTSNYYKGRPAITSRLQSTFALPNNRGTIKDISPSPLAGSSATIYNTTPLTTTTWAFGIYNLTTATVTSLTYGAIITIGQDQGNTGTGNTVYFHTATNDTSIVAVATGGIVAPTNGYITGITVVGGTFTPTSSTASPTSIEYFVVGGGGGSAGGGGGAGGVTTGTSSVTAEYRYVVQAGAGGAPGQQGVGSAFEQTTVSGGGFGGSIGGSNNSGGSGASGGGGGSPANPSYQFQQGGAGAGGGIPGQGNSGGGGGWYSGSASSGGGGGGFTSAGTSGSGSDASGPWIGGNGGAGTTSTFSGSSVTYARGGGGWGWTAVGTPSTAGTPGTGNGGGNYNPGGTGIVMIRYPSSNAPAWAVTGNPTVNVTGGYRIYSWTNTTSNLTTVGSIQFAGPSGYIVPNLGVPGAPGPWTFSLADMNSTAEYRVGSVINAVPQSGGFGSGNTVRVLSITSSTEMVCLARSGDIAPSLGTVSYIQPTGAIDNGPEISAVSFVSSGTWTFVVSNLTSTIMMQVGSVIVATTASGSLASFGTGTTAFVSSILNISQISAIAMGGTAPVAGVINNVSTSGSVVSFNTGSYATLTFVAGGDLTVTNNGTTDVTIFKTSGSSTWNNEARVAQAFTAPCTLEFFKQAANGDNGVSYSMMGWNDDPTANASYTTLDYTAYPYRTDAYSVHHNGSEVQYGGQWDPAKKFYIVYGTDGFIRHYNGATLLYSVFYGTGRTVYVDSSFYSVNGTFGGFSNIRVKTSAWQGGIGYGGQGIADYSIIRPTQILGRQDNWDNIVAVSMVNSLNRPIDYFGNENTEPTLVISNAATASMRNVVVPMFESGVNPGNITDITTVTSTTWSFTINGMRSTNGFTTGTIIFALAVVGTFGTGNQVTVTGITSSTAMTCITSFGTGMPRAGSITGIYATGELEPVSPYIEKVIGTNALTNTTSYSVSFSAANSSYLQYPNSTQFNLVGGAWTAECWIKPSGDYSIYNTIFCKRVTSSGTTSYEGYLRITTGVISFYNGTNYESDYTLTPNVWSHCAWVYTGSILNIYVNGILRYSTSLSLGANNTEPLLIGQARGYNEYFTGLISNFRLVKNIAVYTGPFTPPTSPLGTTQGETTNIAAISTNTFTSLLVCQTNTFTDRSIYSTATTIVGTPSISVDNPFGNQPIVTGPWSYIISGLTSTNAFFGGAIITATTVAGDLGNIGTGTSYVNYAINNRQIFVINNTVGATVTPGSITAVSTAGVVTSTSGPAASYQVAFNGTNQYLTTPSTANYNLSSGDFTVECWVYVTSNGNNTIFTVGTGGSATWNLWQINSDRSITWQTNPPGNWNWVNTYNSSAGQIPLNAWTHIAAVRFGSNFSMYVNGSSVYSTNSFAGAGAGGTLFIGTYYANYNNDGSYFRGNISNFRIVKGTAVYTGNFQLPTSEPGNITNTVLLICRSSTFIDNSSNAVTITPVNSPVISLGTLLLSAGIGSFPVSNYTATIVTPDDFGARPVVWGKTSATSITNKSVSTEQATGIKINVWSTGTVYGGRNVNWETMTNNSPYAEGQVTGDETGQPFTVYTRDATVNYGKTQWSIPEPMNIVRGQAITTSTVVIGISVTATYVSTSSRNALPLRPVTFKNLILPVTNDSGGTGNVGTVYGGGPWTFDISGLKSVTEFSVNSIISSTPNVGSAGVGNVVYVTAINTSTKTLTCLSYGYNAPIQGVINSVYNTGEIVPPTRITSVTTVTGSSWFFNITGVRGTNSLVASAGSGTVITVTTASGSTATVGGNSLVVASVDSVDQIKVFAYGGTTPFIGTITGVVSTSTIGTYPIVGDAEFITPGTYTWVAPAGVTSVSAVAVGGGGAGFNTWANAAGAGAGLGWKNNIAVSSGTSYTVQVGAGGVKNGGAGGNSFFINLTTVAGYGGGNASSGQNTSGPNNNGYGGGYVGDGGGAGGNATNYAGGGGAGGYSGNGGNQQNLPTLNSGGAAGGGYYSSTYGSGAGGGVGLWGRAETATGWWHGNSGQAFSTSAGNGGGGAGGSGGTRGLSGENPLTSTGESGNVDGYGGTFGGGGGGPGTSWPAASGSGGKGGVRIMWGGGRSFPATNAGTFTSIVVLATLTTRSSLIGGPLNDWGTPAATVARMPYPESIGIDRLDTIVITDTITTDAVQIKLFAFNNLSSYNAGSKSITNSLVGSETFFVAGTGTDGATALSAYWI